MVDEIKNNQKVENHYHNYGFDKILKIMILFLLGIIILSAAINWITFAQQHDKNVYDKCIDGCSKKYFSGTRIGFDGNLNNCVVGEFDRTNCIESCNDLYHDIK